MQRIVIEKPGHYDALRLVEQADPVPGPGEVVIACEACGVNYADGIIRMGLYASAKQLHGYPITPGFEVAGRVSALGAGVSGLRVGAPVIGLTFGYSGSWEASIPGHVRPPFRNM
jgi:NADPH:quinone reductase-like Zn-dependent oxidoreductase